MSEIDHPPQAVTGYARVRGNECNVFEKRQAPLCFVQPYYNHVNLGPQTVLKEKRRMTYTMMEDRGAEALAYAGRRLRDVRRLQYEDKDRIKETIERDRAEREAREARPAEKLRWWETRAALEERDLLRTLNATNGRFSAELLLNAKEIVLCDLTGCRLGDDAMNWVSTFIVQNGTLRRLNLQANNITVDGVNNIYRGLSETKSLIDLDLSFNPIGDDGMAALVGAFTENMRFTKIQKINISTCNLSSSACYHVARLIRDFKSLEILLAWRNRLGNCQITAGQDISMTGMGMIFKELQGNNTLMHLDLTCNNITDEFCMRHATEKEQEARQLRLSEIEKTRKQNRIDDLVKAVEELRPIAVYEDQKIELAALEQELVIERKRYAEELARQKQMEKTKKKDAEQQYRELLRQMTGRTLIERKHKLRIVLTGNPSIQPSTLKRLAAFYDVRAVADYVEFINTPRLYDNIVRPARRPGHPEEERDPNYNVFDFEDELLLKERLEREARTKEMDELRRKGYDATAILEERLRGTASGRRRGPGTAGGGSSDGSRSATPGRHTIGVVGISPPGSARDGTPGGTVKSPLAATARTGAGGLLAAPGGGLGSGRTPSDKPLSPRSPAGGMSLPAVSGGVSNLGAGILLHEASGALDSGIDSGNESGNSAKTTPRGGKRSQRRTKRVAGAALVTVTADRLKRGAATTEVPGLDDDDNEALMQQQGVETYDDLDALLAADQDTASDGGFFAKLRAMLPDEAAEQDQALRKIEERNNEIKQRLLERQQLAQSHQDSAAIIPAEETGEEVIAVSDDGAMVHRVEEVADMSTAPPQVASSFVVDAVAAARRIQAAIRAISERGSPSDEDLAELEREQIRLSRFYLDFATKLGELTAYAEVAPEFVEPVIAFIEDVIKGTDRDPNCIALLDALTKRVALDFPSIVENRGLLALAATDGSIEFVRILLEIPDVRYDVPELILSCFYNQTCRIPLTYFVLTSPVLDLSPYVDILGSAWQEFFEDIASSTRAIPKEDRTNRNELIKLMLDTKTFPLDCEVEGSDGRTAFGRACAEGDEYTMTMMSFAGRLTDLNKPNAVGLTPLMQCVTSKSVEAIVAFFDLGGDVDVNATCETGNALDIALMLRVDPQIIKLLKERGAVATVKAGGASARGGAAAASASPQGTKNLTEVAKPSKAGGGKVVRRTTKNLKK